MSGTVGRYGDGQGRPACFESSLERLDDAAEDLAAVEDATEKALEEALLNTLKVGALCLGSVERMVSAACLGAATQHVGHLLELQHLSEQYEANAAEYEAALAEHLACLSR
jgi:hypothetical protein